MEKLPDTHPNLPEVKVKAERCSIIPSFLPEEKNIEKLLIVYPNLPKTEAAKEDNLTATILIPIEGNITDPNPELEPLIGEAKATKRTTWSQLLNVLQGLSYYPLLDPPPPLICS